MTLGRRIYSMRKMRFMSIPDLADKIGIGIATISSYERGLTEPRAETILKLCEVFGCSPTYLLTGKEWGENDGAGE